MESKSTQKRIGMALLAAGICLPLLTASVPAEAQSLTLNHIGAQAEAQTDLSFWTHFRDSLFDRHPAPPPGPRRPDPRPAPGPRRPDPRPAPGPGRPAPNPGPGARHDGPRPDQRHEMRRQDPGPRHDNVGKPNPQPRQQQQRPQQQRPGDHGGKPDKPGPKR